MFRDGAKPYRVFKGVGGVPGDEEKPAIDSLKPMVFERMFEAEKQHTFSVLDMNEQWKPRAVIPPTAEDVVRQRSATAATQIRFSL